MTKQLKTFLKSDISIAFITAIIWQAALTIAGILLSADTSSTLGYMLRWDAGWYQLIITDHYATNAASAAFYPFFPLAIASLTELTFHLYSPQLLALILNTVCLGFGLTALLKIAKYFVSSNYRYLSILFFLAAPAAFFMNIFYGEALFIAIAFWSYLFALQRRWLLVGLLLAALTATRLPSLLFVGLCGLEFLRAYDWNIKKIFNTNILYFLLAPAGFISYGTYLWQTRGDFFAMFNAYSSTTDWAYHVFNLNIFQTIGRATYRTIRAVAGKREFDNDILINHAIPLVCIALIFVSSIYLIIKLKGKGVPLGVFGLVSIVMFTINNNLISVHRYTLPCLTIYIALVLFIEHYKKLRLIAIFIAAVMLSIQVLLLLTLHLTTQFVG